MSTDSDSLPDVSVEGGRSQGKRRHRSSSRARRRMVRRVNMVVAGLAAVVLFCFCAISSLYKYEVFRAVEVPLAWAIALAGGYCGLRVVVSEEGWKRSVMLVALAGILTSLLVITLLSKGETGGRRGGVEMTE